jgi:hypothetical protein
LNWQIAGSQAAGRRTPTMRLRFVWQVAGRQAAGRQTHTVILGYERAGSREAGSR